LGKAGRQQASEEEYYVVLNYPANPMKTMLLRTFAT
jgi:hypothetical protein